MLPDFSARAAVSCVAAIAFLLLGIEESASRVAEPSRILPMELYACTNDGGALALAQQFVHRKVTVDLLVRSVVPCVLHHFCARVFDNNGSVFVLVFCSVHCPLPEPHCYLTPVLAV